jgi:hypothetical protein
LAWQEGHTLDLGALSTLSPYRTESIAFGNYVVNPDRFPEPLEQHLGFSIAGTKLAAPVFYFLGFAACFAATNALPFCFVAAAFACFCAACFCVDFGDLSPIRLNYHPWFGRREPWIDQLLGLPLWPLGLSLVSTEDHKLAKPNYQFEKRKRDIQKKAKKEEKKLRKLRPSDPSPPTVETK